MQTSDQTLETWKNSNIEIKIQDCVRCGLENYCQHQGFCVECMTENHNMNRYIMWKIRGKCGMCGIKTQETICGKCQRGFF